MIKKIIVYLNSKLRVKMSTKSLSFKKPVEEEEDDLEYESPSEDEEEEEDVNFDTDADTESDSEDDEDEDEDSDDDNTISSKEIKHLENLKSLSITPKNSVTPKIVIKQQTTIIPKDKILIKVPDTIKPTIVIKSTDPLRPTITVKPSNILKKIEKSTVLSSKIQSSVPIASIISPIIPTLSTEMLNSRLMGINILGVTTNTGNANSTVETFCVKEDSESDSIFQARIDLSKRLLNINQYPMSVLCATTLAQIIMKKSQLGLVYDNQLELTISHIISILLSQ